MVIFIDGKNLLIVTKPKIYIDLLIKINESLEHDIEFIVCCNECLIEYTIKKRD